MSNSLRLSRHIVICLSLASFLSTAGCASRLYATGGAPAHNPARDAKALSDTAYELLHLGNYDEAEEMCRRAIALDPTLAEAHKNLAIVLCDQGRCAEALAPAKEAVRLKPDFDKAHYVLGKVLLGLGRYQDAAGEYREALRINAEYDKAYFGLGLACDRLNQPEAAVEAFRRAAGIKPQEQDYSDKLMLALRHVGRPERPAPPPSADFKTDNHASHLFKEQVRDSLYHGEFDTLERAASEARKSKERVPGGYWKLEVIYGGLNYPDAGLSAPDAEWQYHIARLREWADKRPQSVTARVGLAGAYVAYAWSARGSGVAGAVTEEGWRLFHERLALAKSVLDDAKGLTPRCPDWYATMMGVATGQGWDLDSFKKLFGEATAFEPTYPLYYASMANYLLPRWYGRAGDWTRFAETVADGAGGKEGSALYYYLVRSLADSSDGEVRSGTFMTNEGVSRSRFGQGLADSEQLYGDSIHDENVACLIASASGDRSTSAALFRRIGDNWAESVWRDRGSFERYKAWALTGR